MKLHWAPRTRSVRAIWMLEEAGVPYELVLADIRHPETFAAEFLAASPLAKVPALVDGDAAVADSAALALYVADRYSPGVLAPLLDDPDRGRFLFWMGYTGSVIEPAMAEKIAGQQPNRTSHGWGDFPAMIAAFEKALAPGPWLLGQKFTAADVLLGSSAVFMRAFKLLPDSTVLDDYASRCLQRPAYQKALAIDANAQD